MLERVLPPLGAEEVIASEPTTLDAQSAREFLEMFPYPRQRSIDLNYVEEYADLMRRGEFWSGSELTVVHAPDDNGLIRGHLINGQHRLRAVIEADVSIIFVVKHIQAESMTEVNARYAVEDFNRRRGARDQIIALDLPARYRLSAYDLKLVDAASTFIRNDFKSASRGRGTPAQKEVAAATYGGPMRIFIEYISGGFAVMTRQMRKRAVLSLALVTIKEARQVYGNEKVEDFWRGVALDSGLKTRDPRKVAVRHLTDLASGSTTRTTKNSPEYTARYVASCFNAWVEDREIQAARVLDERGPIHINGTRWSK